MLFLHYRQPNKEAYETEGGGGQRGYTGFGKEHAAGRTTGDLKEFWHFGQDLKVHKHLKEIYPENIQVSELEHFNITGDEVYKKLEKTAEVLLQAIALILRFRRALF